jgi:hypothetical protein
MRYLTTPVVVFIAAVTQGALAADLRVEVFAGDFASVNSFIFSNGKSLLVLDAQRTPGEARKLAERIHALHLPLDYTWASEPTRCSDSMDRTAQLNATQLFHVAATCVAEKRPFEADRRTDTGNGRHGAARTEDGSGQNARSEPLRKNLLFRRRSG